MSTSQLPYNDHATALRRRLGGRVQKVAIDARLGCPNRDGKLGWGGCTFCLNEAFSPSYCREAESISEQIERGIAFHTERNRQSAHYLAYFQSGTNTYAPVEQLRTLYNEALANPKISGIIIGTRPDCINSEIVDILADIATHKYVAVEYGIESTLDRTLRRVNRHHLFADAERAVELTQGRNIEIGAHFIIGLPGESRADIIATTETINSLNLNYIKLHQLQIYRSTAMAEEFKREPEDFLLSHDFSTDDYIDLLIEFLRHIQPSTAIDRLFTLAPRNLIAHSPLSGERPDTLRQRLVRRMTQSNYRQGDLLF